MRLSSIQKNVLFVLFAIEQRNGKGTYVKCAALNSILNNSRTNPIIPNNFRVSCHTLVENGLLISNREGNLELLFALSDDGRLIANKIHIEREIDFRNERVA